MCLIQFRLPFCVVQNIGRFKLCFAWWRISLFFHACVDTCVFVSLVSSSGILVFSTRRSQRAPLSLVWFTAVASRPHFPVTGSWKSFITLEEATSYSKQIPLKPQGGGCFFCFPQPSTKAKHTRSWDEQWNESWCRMLCPKKKKREQEPSTSAYEKPRGSDSLASPRLNTDFPVDKAE